MVLPPILSRPLAGVGELRRLKELARNLSLFSRHFQEPRTNGALAAPVFAMTAYLGAGCHAALPVRSSRRETPSPPAQGPGRCLGSLRRFSMAEASEE